MARRLARLAAALLAVAGLLIQGSAAVAAPVESGISIDPVEGLSEDFIHGVDVSSVLALEESGVVFRDFDGQQADLFEVLAAAGVTDVRVRVWNDPYDEQGNGYGGGNLDVPRALEVGQRATAAGLRTKVNFHYSDFWADPGKQFAPKAWAGFSTEETAAAVYEFTRDTLQQFSDAGVDVRAVQVGNETNNAVAGVQNWEQMPQIFSAGAKAVREVLPDALVMLHFTNPENNRYAEYAQTLDEHDVDYDVFVSSYYPFWHGTLENLVSELEHVAQTYEKQVAVGEVSWVYSLEDFDGHENTVEAADQAEAYPVSVQGQAWAVRDTIEAVASLGDDGIGVYYWEPAWLPVGAPEDIEQNRVLWERDGSGWATSYASEYDPEDAGQYFGGTSWDNQALFAPDGTPHESLRVFEYVYSGAVTDRVVSHVESVELTVELGENVTLPEAVVVHFNDGSSDEQAVQWSDMPDLSEVGIYSVDGVTEGGLETEARITVRPVNFLLNHGFEDDDLSMWQITGGALTVPSWDDPYSGERSAHFWAEEEFTFALEQEVHDLPGGAYTASATAQGGDSGDGNLSLRLVADDSMEEAAEFELTGHQNWSTPVTDEVQVSEGGSATVILEADLPAGAWGTIDDIELTLVAEADSSPPVDVPPEEEVDGPPEEEENEDPVDRDEDITPTDPEESSSTEPAGGVGIEVHQESAEAPPQGALSATGAAVWAISAGAAALIIIGVAALLLIRRRNS